MTRTAIFGRIGGPDVIELVDWDLPPPPPGEVSVRVEAVGINRGEALFREGRYVVQPSPPCRIGGEGCGVIEALGEGVTGFEIGERVCVIPTFTPGEYGMLAERANLPVGSLVKSIPGMDPVAAASLWVSYSTAYGMVELAGLGERDHVIVSAASSSVGTAAIQIARAVGAIPIATTRNSAKAQGLIDIGAAHVVVTEEQDLVAEVMRITDGRGARVAFDAVVGPFLQTLAAAMADDGQILLYGDLSDQPATLPIYPICGKHLSISGFVAPRHIWGIAERFARASAFFQRGFDSGAIDPVVARVFSLEQSVEAHEYLASDAQLGKVVVKI